MSLERNEENQRLIDFRERELRDMIDFYETGKDEGKADEREAIIINLLKMKIPIEKIAETTKATKEKIEKIKKRNYNKEV